MSANAELWTRPDERSQRIGVCSWLRSHNIPYSEDMTTEELTELYRDVECGRYKKL